MGGQDTTRRGTTARGAALLMCLLAILVVSGAAHAQDGAIECTYLYEHANGIYVDVGLEEGLEKGRTGWLFRKGRRVARVQVIAATHQSSFLRVLSARPENFAEVRDDLTLTLDPAPPKPDAEAGPDGPTDQEGELEVLWRPDEPAAEDAAEDPAPGTTPDAPVDPPATPPSTLKSENPELPTGPVTDDEGFRPLLAPYSDIGIPDPQNVVQGRVTLTQEFQETSNNGLDYQRTHLSSAGSVERVGGTPWAFEWDGDLSARYGSGLADVDDHEDLRLEMYRLAISRRFDDRSFVRLGRFIPRELPSVGYVDGLQFESVLSDSWRAGAVGGFRPDREHLDVSFDELTLTPYVTYYDDEDGEQYSATVGLLGNYYEGDVDRLALLADQSFVHDELFVDLSTEVDLDVGNFESRDGIRLTRANLAASYLMDGWTPRASVDRYELLDIEAERDLVGVFLLNEADYFDDEWWRYSLGASHALGGGFVLDEEVSYSMSDYDDALHWQVGMTKNGVLGMPAASATATVYNLSGGQQDGYAARLSSWIPLPRRDLIVQPAVTYRWVDFDVGGSNFEYVDVSLYLHWRPKRAWEVFGNVSGSVSDNVSRIYGQLGVTWRF